ncbi:MAG TPA: hypothetical protein VGG40_13440 [Solirubrobacterales bacterium]|jgi:hypothetical protein
MSKTPQELRAFSEHLLYELQMLFRLADRLRAHSEGHEQLPWEVEMACIESFAIHARALEGFIWADRKGGRYPDDALAADYFLIGAWATLRQRVQRSALDGMAARTGHEVAHLSYKRSAKSEAERNWPFDVIAGVIGRAFRLFLEFVPADHVVDDFESRLRSTWPEYLNYRVAMSFPPDQNPKSVATTMFRGPGQPARFEDLLN